MSGDERAALVADDDTLPCRECGADISEECRPDCPTRGSTGFDVSLGTAPGDPMSAFRNSDGSWHLWHRSLDIPTNRAQVLRLRDRLTYLLDGDPERERP